MPMQEHKELTWPRTALTYKPCVLILILMIISRPSSPAHKLFMFMLWSNGHRKERGARERHERRVRTPAREPRRNRLLPLPSRVSFARPVLSCAHYFRAPATHVALVYACVMLSLMVMLMLVLARLVRTGLYKAKLQINFSLSYRC